MDREIRQYLEESLFPRVWGDGGWMEIAGEEGGQVRLTAKGECAICHCADRCATWLADMVRKRFGAEIKFTVEKKPFIWRT